MKAVRNLPLLALVWNFPARAQELTLERAVQLAVESNREIANATLEVNKADDRSAALRTRLLPSFNLYALGGQQLSRLNFTIDKGTLGNFASTGPVPASDVNYSSPLGPTAIVVGRIAQPITPLRRVRLNIGLLNISKKSMEEQVRQKRQQVARDVKKLYYDIQQIESSLTAVRETLKLYRELDQLTADYVRREVTLEVDHLQVQTRLARTEQMELTLTDQEATAKEQLNQLLGRDVLMEFTVSRINSTLDSETDMALARQQALEQRPEIRQAHLQIEQAEQDVRAKKTEYIPDVSAEFNTVTLANFGAFLPRQFASVGVSVSWDAFDWGRKKHELAEKKRTVEQGRNAEVDARNGVIVDVHNRFRQLQQARAQLRVTQLGQQTAIESLRLARTKYEQQAVLVKDVLQEQAGVEQANTDYLQALAKFWTAKAELEHATGADQ